MTDQNPQRFSTFIAEHRAGLADADLTSAMQEVAHRCALTGKAGVVTLQIKVSPKGDMLSIVDTLAVKLPAPPAEERLYWIGSDGSLTRNHPNQPQLTRPDGTPPDPMHVGPTSDPTTTGA